MGGGCVDMMLSGVVIEGKPPLSYFRETEWPIMHYTWSKSTVASVVPILLTPEPKAISLLIPIPTVFYEDVNRNDFWEYQRIFKEKPLEMRPMQVGASQKLGKTRELTVKPRVQVDVRSVRGESSLETSILASSSMNLTPEERSVSFVLM